MPHGAAKKKKKKLRFKMVTESMQESVGVLRSTGPWLYTLLTCEASPGLERAQDRQLVHSTRVNLVTLPFGGVDTPLF